MLATLANRIDAQVVGTACWLCEYVFVRAWGVLCSVNPGLRIPAEP
jgi:hypothetical protein